MLFCRLWIFFKSYFFKNIFQEYHQCVKQFGSRSGPKFCRAWSGSKLFAKVISRWQKSPLAGKEFRSIVWRLGGGRLWQSPAKQRFSVKITAKLISQIEWVYHSLGKFSSRWRTDDIFLFFQKICSVKTYFLEKIRKIFQTIACWNFHQAL